VPRGLILKKRYLAIFSIIFTLIIAFAVYYSIPNWAIIKTEEEIEKLPDVESIEQEPIPTVQEKLVRVRLTIGYRFEYPNGSVYRPIHGYVIGEEGTMEWDNHIVEPCNITVTVQFPYENATYNGYTEETYFVAEKIERKGTSAGYCWWEVTSIDKEYIDAKAYGWIKNE